MSYLKSYLSVLLFFVAFCCTLTVINVIAVQRVEKAIAEFEPVIIEASDDTQADSVESAETAFYCEVESIPEITETPAQESAEPDSTEIAEPEPETATETVTEESTETETLPTGTLYDVPLDADVQAYIIETATAYGIDPAVIFGVAQKESTFRADAVGDGGNSLGLCQIQPRWHGKRMELLGVTDLTDPKQNALVAIDYLAELCDYYDGNIEMAPIAYNAGQAGAYNNYFSQGIYSNGYSSAVLSNAANLGVLE